MALGFTFGGDGGDIIPIIKFDARAGRMFRRDRVNGENDQTDITSDFKAIFDFENVETGTINFDTGSAPDFAVVRYGERIPAPPTDKHRPGVRILVKLGKDSGGDIRELASTAKVFLSGIDRLHNDYLAGVKNNAGKLPIVALTSSLPITTGEGARKSTNYSPVFEIVGWATRPTDLTYIPRSGSAGGEDAPATVAAPPATGSTRVSAPSSSDDDFG